MAALVLKQKSDSSDDQSKARDQIRVGRKLYGYCYGYFGRDSYGEKTILYIHENKYIVVEDDRGVTITSRPINDWVELVKSSNNALDEIEGRIKYE